MGSARGTAETAFTRGDRKVLPAGQIIQYQDNNKTGGSISHKSWETQGPTEVRAFVRHVEECRRVSKGVEGCRRGTWDDVEGYNQGRDTTPPLRPRAPRGHRAASNDLRLSKIKITDRKGAEPITKRFFSLCHVHLAKFSRNCLSPLKPFQRRTENAETNGEVEGGGKRGGRAIQGGEGFGGERGVEGSLPSLSGEGR